MIVTLLGKRWTLRFTPLRKQKGDCDGPHIKGKQIRVDSKLRGEKQLEITIHECMHAMDWAKSEEYITQEARDLARVLWKLGYRRTDD